MVLHARRDSTLPHACLEAPKSRRGVLTVRRCPGPQEALLAMDDSALTVEQLDALSRAVPEEQELKDLALYLEVRSAGFIEA
jgi:hypothetical protein